jgi:hypothetical protein
MRPERPNSSGSNDRDSGFFHFLVSVRCWLGKIWRAILQETSGRRNNAENETPPCGDLFTAGMADVTENSALAEHI